MQNRTDGASEKRDRLGREYLFDQLTGSACSYCGGTLVRGTYKDNDAVVCGECGAPAAQFW